MQLANYCQHQFGATMIREQPVTRAGSSGYVLVIEQNKG